MDAPLLEHTEGANVVYSWWDRWWHWLFKSDLREHRYTRSTNTRSYCWLRLWAAWLSALYHERRLWEPERPTWLTNRNDDPWGSTGSTWTGRV